MAWVCAVRGWAEFNFGDGGGWDVQRKQGFADPDFESYKTEVSTSIREIDGQVDNEQQSKQKQIGSVGDNYKYQIGNGGAELRQTDGLLHGTQLLACTIELQVSK